MDNVEIIGEIQGDRASGCKTLKYDSYDKTSGSYRIKCKVSHQTWPWSKYVLAKTINYKKNKKGNFRRERAYIKTRVYGKVSGVTIQASSDPNDSDGYDTIVDCTLSTTFNTSSGVYSSWSNVKSREHKITVPTNTNTTWVKGYHEGINSTNYTSTLTF